jgi:hypothetical protein
MSDQGIVSLGQLKNEAVGTYNDLKKAVQPAVEAVKGGARKVLEFDKSLPFPVESIKKAMNAADDSLLQYLTESPVMNEVSTMKPIVGIALKEQPYATIDPKYATKIKGMISPSGIQQDSTLDKIRFGRDFKNRTSESMSDIDNGLK